MGAQILARAAIVGVAIIASSTHLAQAAEADGTSLINPSSPSRHQSAIFDEWPREALEASGQKSLLASYEELQCDYPQDCCIDVVDECPSCGFCDSGCEAGCGSGCECGSAMGGYLSASSPLSVWLYGAPTYISDGDGFGFSEGAVVGYRMTDALGIFGGGGFNHTDDSTQFLGTVGLQRFGNPQGGSAIDRTTVWVLWDQFTDTDTDSDVSQFRFQFGYVLAPRTEIGMSYSTPTGDDDGVGQIPLGGFSNITTGDSYVGPYISAPVRNAQVFTTAGYSDRSDEIAGGVGAWAPLQTPVSDNSRVFVDTKYGGDDQFAISAGLAFGFGRADTTHY